MFRERERKKKIYVMTRGDTKSSSPWVRMGRGRRGKMARRSECVNGIVRRGRRKCKTVELVASYGFMTTIWSASKQREVDT